MPIPFPELTPAAEIGGVLERIASVIAWSIDNATRVGYFAALYERITRAVGAACEVPIIDDGIVTLRDDAWRFASFLGGEIGAIQGPTIAARDRSSGRRRNLF